MADKRARELRHFAAYVRADLPRQDFYQRLTCEQRRIVYESIAQAERTMCEKNALRAKRRERYATRRAQAHAVAEAEAILFAHV